MGGGRVHAASPSPAPTNQPRPPPIASSQGEIAPRDRPLVPAPKEPPSKEFLEQLREYTSWRLQPGVDEEGEEAAAVATHLGAKKKKGGGAAR